MDLILSIFARNANLDFPKLYLRCERKTIIFQQSYYASITCKEWASSNIEKEDEEVVKRKRADLY